MEKSKSIIWKQFKNRKIGFISFIIVIIMFGIAIFAPFLANDKPIYIYSKYPTLYDYFYTSAEQNFKVLIRSAGREDELRALEDHYVAGFNRQRDIIAELNARLIEVGNDYDAVISRIYSVESQIERSRRRGITDLDHLYDRLEALEQERNEIGGIRNRIQAEIAENTNIQDFEYNQPLLEVRFLLASGRSVDNLRNALMDMKKLVDDSIKPEIDKIIQGIEQISPDEMDRTILENKLTDLGALSLDNIQEHLVYKGLYPIISSLGMIDIFLILFFLSAIIILITGPHNIFNIQKMGILIFALLIITFILYAVIPNLPKQNYKVLMANNIERGMEDTFGIFPIIPFGLNENNFYESYQKPSFVPTDGVRSRHLLGTDDNGRSILTRIIWGSRVSLSVGFVSVGLYSIIGIIIGSIAGYYGKGVDIAVSRVIEIMMCFPSFFLILAVIAFIGPSIYNIMIVIGLTRWTGIARLVRGEFLRIKTLDYVQAGRALGAKAPRSIALHILPNALTPVLVSAAFGFAGAVLVEAGLSFLGFGVQDPMSSWGQMLSASRGHPLLYWWMFITPGFALFITVTLYNLIGNTLRDAIDPRLRM